MPGLSGDGCVVVNAAELDARTIALALVEARLSGDHDAARVLIAADVRWKSVAMALSGLLAREALERRHGDVADALADVAADREWALAAFAGGAAREGGDR